METLSSFIFFFSLIYALIFIRLVIAADTITREQSLSDTETLVSANENFELGFFSPGNSKNRYLGIWYKKTPDQVVWVANRDNPVADSYGELKISNNGNLVVLNQSRSTIWSSNISSVPKNPVLQLLDSGNLVLRDNSSTIYLWQSFDFPSDTLLPDMKISWNMESGQERYLTSWKAPDDPSRGNSSYKIDKKGLPQLVLLVGSAIMFRTGQWDGVRFTGVYPVSNQVLVPLMEFDGHEWSYKFEQNSNKVFATVITVTQSGSVQRLVLNHGSSEWTVLYSVPNEPCNNYGNCGPNGICRISKYPICECLEGFVPKSSAEWKSLTWTGGCIRRTPLKCHIGDQFMQLAAVKLPDLLEFRLNKSMTLEQCKAECLRNCACTAYANSDVRKGETSCVMWFGDLIDMRELPQEEKEHDIYIRLAASEIESMHKSKRKNGKITIMVAATISGICFMGFTFWCIIWKIGTKRRGLESKKEDIDLPIFDLATISRATKNFSNTSMLGEGGFGPVYKGSLSTGEEIAVKRLSKNSGQGLEEFKNEVLLIAKLQHRNLVGLLGCCIQGEERVLIYEYMSNKSLDHFIFDHSKSASLSWEKRFDIIMGIARGLLYLHQDSKLQIIHRDLKASNILLDSNMNPKISDFGLARIVGQDEIEPRTKKVIGTYGYMSPEYAVHGKYSVKSDVFSFGVVLLEIISGRRNRGFSHPDHHHNLLGHTWLLWNEEKALELVDPSLEDSSIESQVLRCIQVGLLCVQKFPADRPMMASVVFMLANDDAKLPWPKEPAFFIERSSTDVDSMSTNYTTITTLEGR
ncbi:S-receptor-like serine/threonine-protein kinase [Trema orientale]|uniref:Receptor-like serine/threonine-protein kinase n=1 Tax=Trema orientale TaxID=63057 RepID=A0A2P5EM56_TREOI|nr:S-receptor-like serine/threonine-protein kinase [Trema orientale]